jgi:uncharacterized membrane protein YfcA
MRIRHLDESPNPLNAEHEQLGIPPVEDTIAAPKPRLLQQYVISFGLLGMLASVAWLLGDRLLPPAAAQVLADIGQGFTTTAFWMAVLVGLFAQIVDGALGMAYGITATTFLLSTGVSPAAASASVHIAEIFTTGLSGWSHWRFGNVDKALFKRLLVPGLVGAVAGAYLITSLDGNTIKPFISAYLLLMGLYILYKAYRHVQKRRTDMPKHVGPLALLGGFVDAVGGGGWGPVVTSSLIGTGNNPRTTIGSVNAAEFFLAISTSATFLMLVGTTYWTVIAGLVIGGMFAAPMAAWLCRHLKTRTLLTMVGVLITFLSLVNLYKALA